MDWRHSLAIDITTRIFCCAIVLRYEVVDCYEIRRDPVCFVCLFVYARVLYCDYACSLYRIKAYQSL
jgi:hypothetical protein